MIHGCGLLADDLVTLTNALDVEVADENAIRAQRAAVEATLTQARARESELEQMMAVDAPRLADAQETWYRLSALEERFRGTASLAAERARHLSVESTEVRTARDPDALESEALECASSRPSSASRSRNRGYCCTRPSAAARTSNANSPRPSAALVTAARAVADRREGLAKLSGQVDVLRTRSRSAADEIERLSTASAEARERAAAAARDLGQLEGAGGRSRRRRAEPGTSSTRPRSRPRRWSRPRFGCWPRPSASPSASGRPGPPDVRRWRSA